MAIEHSEARAKLGELSRINISIVNMLNTHERGTLFAQFDSLLTVELTQAQIDGLADNLETAANNLKSVAGEVKDLVKEA